LEIFENQQLLDEIKQNVLFIKFQLFAILNMATSKNIGSREPVAAH
jgi:hypothetical protein